MQPSHLSRLGLDAANLIREEVVRPIHLAKWRYMAQRGYGQVVKLADFRVDREEERDYVLRHMLTEASDDLFAEEVVRVGFIGDPLPDSSD